MIEQEYYENYGNLAPEDYIKERILNNSKEIARFQKVIEALLEKIENVLDVGCGNAVFLKLLREEKPNIISKGLERSRVMADAARKMFNLDFDL